MNELNAEAISRPIFESIHHSYANSDYNGLLEIDLSDDMREALTKDVFDQAIDKYYSKYGELVAMTYLGYVSRDAGHQLLWKCSYDKNTEEVVWQIYLSKSDDNKYQVLGIWFGY